MQVLAHSMSGEDLPPGSQTAVSSGPSDGRRGGKPSGVIRKGATPFRRAPPS